MIEYNKYNLKDVSRSERWSNKFGFTLVSSSSSISLLFLMFTPRCAQYGVTLSAHCYKSRTSPDISNTSAKTHTLIVVVKLRLINFTKH